MEGRIIILAQIQKLNLPAILTQPLTLNKMNRAVKVTSYPPGNLHTKLQSQDHYCSRNGSRSGGVETDNCVRSSSLIFWGDSCGGVGGGRTQAM